MTVILRLWVKDLALLKITGHFYFSMFFCGHFCPCISKPFKTNTLTLEWPDKGWYSQTHLSKQVGKVLSLLSPVTRVASIYDFTKVARDCTDFRDMYNFARYVAFIKLQTAVNMSCKPATWIVISLYHGNWFSFMMSEEICFWIISLSYCWAF